MTTSPRPPGDQAITIPDPDWRQLATCQHAKPEPFFPVYHSLRLGRIRGSGRQGGPSAERAFTAALKARPMISIAGQLDGSARGYQEPFALCGSHGYPVDWGGRSQEEGGLEAAFKESNRFRVPMRACRRGRSRRVAGGGRRPRAWERTGTGGS